MFLKLLVKHEEDNIETAYITSLPRSFDDKIRSSWIIMSFFHKQHEEYTLKDRSRLVELPIWLQVWGVSFLIGPNWRFCSYLILANQIFQWNKITNDTKIKRPRQQILANGGVPYPL